MLRELTIENYALIDRLSLEFGDGLTVLTGETGAGKSIIVGALALALGSRSDASVIRAGAGSARIDCAFDVPDALETALNAVGHDTGLDRTLILSRVVSTDGRSKCWVNGRPSTVGALAEIGDMLVDFHGQHEHQQLYRPTTHIEYLDRFGGAPIAKAKRDYQEARTRLLDSAERLAGARADAGSAAEQLAKTRESFFEIESAAINSADEDEILTVERAKLRNVSKIAEALTIALTLLEGDENSLSSRGVLAEISQAEKALASISEFDPMIAESGASLAEASIVTGELVRDLRDYQARLFFSPERLSEIEDRLALLKHLKEEYGPTLAEVIDEHERLRAHLEAGESSGGLVHSLELEHEQCQQQVVQAAELLTGLRGRFGEELSRLVSSELGALALEGASFRVHNKLPPGESAAHVNSSARPINDLAPVNGFDQIEFLVSGNPGEPEQPLAKVISGGEASRVMLAIKLALRGTDPVDTLVFDEIDAGIGGVTATAIGSKLAALARSRQVICITHLAQIASFAGDQYHVEKSVDGGRTLSKAVRLEGGEKIAEIARMLGGNTDSSASRAHAEELMERAREECIKE